MGLPTTTEYYYYYYYDDIVKMTPGVQIPSAIGLTLLMTVAIVGNALTILSYITDPKLHTVYNFYILNLAITDLLLSCISMPFYAYYTLTEFTWPFGYIFCKVYLVMDFTLCFESILLMLILSLDRLLLIVLGTGYQSKITMKVAGAQVAVSWLVLLLVYGPAIIGWDQWVGYSTVEENDCDQEFAYDFEYTTGTAFVEFIIPFVILTSLNTVIYYKIRQRRRVSPTYPTPTTSTNCAVISSRHLTKTQIGNHAQSDIEKTVQARESQDVQQKPNRQEKTVQATESQAIQRKPNVRFQQNNSPASRESKAARLLAILVVVFLIYWAPYTITTVIISFCDACVNTSLYEFFNWVLWSKSALNPLLYAFNSVRYRNNFRKLLTCNRRSFNGATDTASNRTENTNI